MFKKTAEENKKRDGDAKTKTHTQDKNNTVKNDSDQDFYRSQKEVNEAFKKRFASEKEKWGKEQEDKHHTEKEGDKVLSLMKTIEDQAEEFNKIYPDIDIQLEIMSNPLFTYLVMNGKPLIDTYEFLYADTAKARMKNELEQEILGNLKARNTRPRVINSANS